MSIITRTLVLTGARAGQTIKLGKAHQFIDGQIILRGSSPDVEALTHFLAVNYAAYPVGSDELEAWNGKCNIPADEEPDKKHPVLSGAESGGEGTPTEAPSNISEADGTIGGPALGRIPEGDGHEDTRLDRIEEALSQLDMMDDSHWTTTGAPMLSVVEDFLGEKLTRVELKAAAPDFKREG